jgi:hypothetical protein
MKMTLLEIVQDTLNDLGSDTVNTLGETVESTQIAAIVRSTYFDLVTLRDDWPFLNALSAFEGIADTARPTFMLLKSEMNKIEWVKYNKKDVVWMCPKEFKDMIDSRTTGATIDGNGYITNRDPKYWTSYDEEYVVFDSYDGDVESTLIESKSAVYGQMAPSWDHEDDFTPTLPDKMFPTFLADVKSKAFLIVKQTPNSKEETNARKGKIRFQNNATRNEKAEPTTNRNINYGRK